METFELIIFDCDGVLIDSERITNIVFAKMLNELGLPVTLDDMFDRFVGNSMNRCLEIITELLGHAPPENFLDEYHTRINVALESDLRPVPGLDAVLQGIRVPYCVASNGDRRKMHKTLGLTGLLSRFEGRIFSVNDVTRGKPAPDLFLHAASSCGARPSACLVVEDSPTGVAAGIAAGMTVYGYSALTPATRLVAAGAHRVFDDLAELPSLIGRRGT
jgi:HAD superfamily hydrolase (TIGR01509 family)